MLIASYIFFLLASYFIAIQIFPYSTYYTSFARGLPLLVIYGCGVGFFISEFFPTFWFTQIWASGLSFWLYWRKSNSRMKVLWTSLIVGGYSDEERQIFRLSVKNIKAYYILSVLTIFMVYFISFSLFFNLKFHR